MNYQSSASTSALNKISSFSLPSIRKLPNRQYKKKTIFNLDTGVWRVEYGLIKKVGLDMVGNEIGVNLCGVGAYLVSTPNHPLCVSISYKALEDSKIVKCVTRADVDINALLQQYIDAENFIFLRGHKLREEDPEYEGRLHLYLEWVKNKAGRRFLDFLTQQDIADFLGTTRVTITRYLSKMYINGDIDKRHGKVIV